MKLHSQKFHFIPGTYVLLILMFTLNFRVKQVLLLFLPGSGHQNIKLRHFEICIIPHVQVWALKCSRKKLFFSFLVFRGIFQRCWAVEKIFSRSPIIVCAYSLPMVFRSMQKNPLQFLKEYIFKVFYCRLFQVSAAGANAQGSGPNKKLAKRSAAESLLQIMGYSRPSLQPAKPALKNTNSNGSTASSSTSSTMSTSSITNGELKTTHSAHSPASKDKTKKVIFLFTYKF